MTSFCRIGFHTQGSNVGRFVLNWSMPANIRPVYTRLKKKDNKSFMQQIYNKVKTKEYASYCSPGQLTSSLSSSQVGHPSHCQFKGMHWMAPLWQANCTGVQRSSVKRMNTFQALSLRLKNNPLKIHIQSWIPDQSSWKLDFYWRNATGFRVPSRVAALLPNEHRSLLGQHGSQSTLCIFSMNTKYSPIGQEV